MTCRFLLAPIECLLRCVRSVVLGSHRLLFSALLFWLSKTETPNTGFSHSKNSKTHSRASFTLHSKLKVLIAPLNTFSLYFQKRPFWCFCSLNLLQNTGKNTWGCSFFKPQRNRFGSSLTLTKGESPPLPP